MTNLRTGSFIHYTDATTVGSHVLLYFLLLSAFIIVTVCPYCHMLCLCICPLSYPRIRTRPRYILYICWYKLQNGHGVVFEMCT